MFNRSSIHLKFGLVFLLTMALVGVALLAGLGSLRVEVLRNEARAVANQVVSFRAWVAQSGMVWVKNLAPGFHDYLADRTDAEGGHWYGKNPALATREVSTIVAASAQRATFRVTSDEYRQPKNAPDAFERDAIASLKQGREMGYREGFEGGEYRYAEPIYVTEACLKCHGDPATAPKEVIEKYGSDRAFGYKVGDVRGIISVRLPDLGVTQVLRTLMNPVTIVLLVVAFLVSYLYVDRGVIRRVRTLTRQAEAIAEGDMEQELRYGEPARSRDEIDHLYNAVNLLRNSLKVAMRRMQKH
jgi:HAMP domain-containing protein